MCVLRFVLGLNRLPCSLSSVSLTRILAVEEVRGHEQLEGDLRLDGELGDLRARVGVAHLVREVHAHLGGKGERGGGLD